MKKLTILSVLFMTCLMNPLLTKATGLNSSYCIQSDGTRYKLVLETIFEESDLQKVEKSLVEIGAPFEIESIDYKSKTMVIKMTRKAPFDDVKQSIDKLGLRIMKDELIK